MDNYLDTINSMVIDVLKEIGNIGAGHAATALAKLVNRKVDMAVPKVNILEFQEVPELLGVAETEVCGVFFKIEGDLNGSMMFLLDLNSAHQILELLMPNRDKIIDEFATSALSEIGNILSGSYIASLSALTRLHVKISPPALTIDMAGAILSVPAIEFGLMGDKVLIIENEFLDFKEGEKMRGFFFMIPDMDSYSTLLNSLGVSI